MSLYGSLSGNTSNTAAYQVDDQEPKTIQLVAPNMIEPGFQGISSDFVLTNQMFFNASGLSVGEHEVTVTFNGSAMDMPLFIDYFYVTSLTAAEQATLTSPNVTLSSTTIHHHSTRVLVGAVVAVIALMIGAILVTTCRNRRKKMKGRPTFIDPFSFPATLFSVIPPSKLQIMGLGRLYIYLIQQGNDD